MWRMRLCWAMAIAVVAAAPAVPAQQASDLSDPEAVLRRTRERLLAELDRLPRYTCVQTITRRYYAALQGGSHSCARLIEDHEKRKNEDELPLYSWDRLRLEVAIAEGQNVYSWLGAAKFEAGNFEELAGRGPLGSGDFGTFLEAVLRRANIGFQEEKTAAGRRLLEYSYDMPLVRSEYLVKRDAEWVPTAYSGSFLLDPDAADITTMTVRTAELPESNLACQAISEVEYGRTMIHDHMILIPRETRLTTINREGDEAVSVTTYQNCREWASKSRMLLSAPNEVSPAAAPQAQPVTPPQHANTRLAGSPVTSLSPALRFQCRIVTPIDSDTAAAGDPIEGVLSSPIHDKKNNLLVPAGARLRGRLILVEHRFGIFHTIHIAVRWESIEAGGRDVLLRATPQPEFSNRVGLLPAVSDADSPGMHAFIFRGDHLRLPRFDWTWTTVAATASGESGLNGPAAHRRTVAIIEDQFPIEAASGVHFKFSVPAGASGVILEGTFSAAGGSSNDVAVALYSRDEFAKWQDGEPAIALYESGRTRQAELNVPLPAEAGTYYLVFSNNFPLSTPKVVQASLRVHYTM